MSKKAQLFLALLIVFCNPSSLYADNLMDAGNLIEVCSVDPSDDAQQHLLWFCHGFFQAIHDQQTLEGNVCTPAYAVREDLVELYLREAAILIDGDQELSTEMAIVVMARILKTTYPCG